MTSVPHKCNSSTNTYTYTYVEEEGKFTPSVPEGKLREIQGLDPARVTIRTTNARSTLNDLPVQWARDETVYLPCLEDARVASCGQQGVVEGGGRGESLHSLITRRDLSREMHCFQPAKYTVVNSQISAFVHDSDTDTGIGTQGGDRTGGHALRKKVYPGRFDYDVIEHTEDEAPHQAQVHGAVADASAPAPASASGTDGTGDADQVPFGGQSVDLQVRKPGGGTLVPVTTDARSERIEALSARQPDQKKKPDSWIFTYHLRNEA